MRFFKITRFIGSNISVSIAGASQGSPSPDQFNSESPATSSPHREVTGQYSREATPVNHSDRGGKQYDRVGVTV